MSEEKFSKCEEGEKNVSVEFRVFGKKRKLKEKFREKNQSVFGENSKWKILLSSCSLFGVYVNLQVTVTGKMMKIFKVFFGWVFKVKVTICWER